MDYRVISALAEVAKGDKELSQKLFELVSNELNKKDPVVELKKIKELESLRKKFRDEEYKEERLNKAMKDSLIRSLTMPSSTGEYTFCGPTSVSGTNNNITLNTPPVPKNKEWDIDLDKLAYLQTNDYLPDNFIKGAVKQAISSNIAIDESSLVVRDIYPDLDLLDNEGRSIENISWNNLIPIPISKTFTGKRRDDIISVYKTGKLCNYERKVYCFSGFQLLEDNNVVVGANFKNDQVKVKAILDLTTFTKEGDYMGFTRPIIYKASEALNLEYIIQGGARIPHIKLNGVVVEALEQSVVP
ncbi:MAG: hypothetical protein R3321_02605 [Nitrososphaeraceae archaeon]|nr:hypothetical protein [Nitrososphaeraceae archaeon]